MSPSIDAYVEAGKRRVFAGALEWPGWCRSGLDEDSALGALVAYGPRYRAALGRAARGFAAPRDVSALEVVERLEGNATTDFGAPAMAPAGDERPLDRTEAARWAALLVGSWEAFDRSAETHAGAVLRKGPRGGGRDLDPIVDHVLGAERAYLSRAGGKHGKPEGAGAAAEMAAVREAFLHAVSARARGEPPPRTPRPGRLWTPRYSVRRSAWHALDHAWEIEDRAE